MDITVTTKLHPVIGKPMGQSLSSRIGNRIYEMLGTDCYRFPIEIDKEDVGPVLNGLKHMNITAIGVTKPYKREVIQYLDEVDEFAMKLGAVNSIRLIDGKLVGRNVDGEAFMRSLRRSTDCDLNKTTFFCFGAGGAGRAICCTLADKGAKRIIVTDKFRACAEELVGDINRDFAPVAEFVDYEDKVSIKELFRQSDIVMNASGVGMYPHLGESPAERDWFLPSQIAFDATYNPAQTQFLKDAEAMGCKFFSGKGMIIACQMISYEERFGSCPEYEVYSNIFDELLEEYAVPRQ